MGHTRNERSLRRSRRWPQLVLAASLASSLVSLEACESSHILVGTARPAIAARDVTFYTTPPTTNYEQIAILETSSKRSLAFTESGKTEVVLDRLRAEAARLGANGVLLRAVLDQPDGSVGAGVGTSLTGVHGTVGVGWGTSTGRSIKIGRGVAIYVVPGAKLDTEHP
jgi:hypothetical protein